MGGFTGKWDGRVIDFEINFCSDFNKVMNTWERWRISAYANRVQHHGERPKRIRLSVLTLKVELTRQPEIANIEIEAAPEIECRIKHSVTNLKATVGEKMIVLGIADELTRIMLECEEEWKIAQ